MRIKTISPVQRLSLCRRDKMPAVKFPKAERLPKLLRVARIPYLNTDPFFADWRSPASRLVSASPRQLGRWAAEGKVDAGPVPLVDFWKLEGIFDPIGSFGIAVKREARSVLLFSKKPMDQLAGAAIGVTDQTSTSVQLLQILLASRYGVQANFRSKFKISDDARLMIGDAALQAREAGLREFPHIIDLGTEWNDWRRLPFVFARWAVRKTVPAHLKEELSDQLDSALNRCEKDNSGVIARGAERLNLSRDIVQKYLDGFIYRLGEPEMRAETAFHDLVTGKVPGCGC